jgi:hypothetical protein
MKNAIAMLEQIEREKAADRTLVDALIRYQIVATATRDLAGAAWARTQIKMLETSSHEMEVSKLLRAVETYTAECKAIGYDGGLERGTQIREGLKDPAFYSS